MSNPIPSFVNRSFVEFLRSKTSIEVPDSETVIDWVRDNLEPVDVFSEDVLTIWAELNGFVRKESDLG